MTMCITKPQNLGCVDRSLTIEPERSVIVKDYQSFLGVKSILQREIPGFYIVNNSDIGFRYPTAERGSYLIG